MDIHRWCIPAVHATDDRLITDHGSHFSCQFLIPGLCQCHRVRIIFPGSAIDQSVCRIRIGTEWHINGINILNTITGKSDRVVVIFISQFVQKVIPLWIIKIKSTHLDQGQTVFLSVNDLVIKLGCIDR